VACDAFEYGIHVLTEKPMDIDYESAAHAVAYAKEKGVKFGVISQCRYNDAVQYVKKTLESGRLGKLLSVRSILTWNRADSYYTTSDWKGRWDKEGGGVLINQAIHSLDLAHWMIDSEVEDVHCKMSNYNHSVIEVEDTVEGYVTYKNGVGFLFYYSNNNCTNDEPELRLYCEKGKVVFTYDDAYITYADGTKEEKHRETKPMECKGGKDYWGVQHGRQIRHFYNAILDKEPLFLCGEETLKTHALVMQIYKIGKEGMKK
jgi:predicted dehydrogenase